VLLAQLFIAIATSLQLWLVGLLPAAPQAAAQGPVQVAQASRQLSPADRAAAEVLSIQAERRAAVAEKAIQAERHGKNLDEVDRLKRGKASWRRERQLKKALAASKRSASALSKIDRRIRSIDKRMRAAQRKLLAAINAELFAGKVDGKRRRQLGKWARATRRSLVRRKKIVLPDQRIDPLADPEDLEYQAARIAESEKDLEREIQDLIAREERYDKMVKLRSKSNRAAELGRFDDDRPRRTTGSFGTTSGTDRGAGAGGFEADDNASPSPESPLDSDPSDTGGLSGGASDPTVILSDVVDSVTLNELRKADRTGDPRARARATKRTRKAVQQQLEQLRRARKRIENRARKLRR
jgi:hypothetical protein